MGIRLGWGVNCRRRASWAVVLQLRRAALVVYPHSVPGSRLDSCQSKMSGKDVDLKLRLVRPGG